MSFAREFCIQLESMFVEGQISKQKYERSVLEGIKDAQVWGDEHRQRTRKPPSDPYLVPPANDPYRLVTVSSSTKLHTKLHPVEDSTQSAGQLPKLLMKGEAFPPHFPVAAIALAGGPWKAPRSWVEGLFERAIPTVRKEDRVEIQLEYDQPVFPYCLGIWLPAGLVEPPEDVSCDDAGGRATLQLLCFYGDHQLTPLDIEVELEASDEDRTTLGKVG